MSSWRSNRSVWRDLSLSKQRWDSYKQLKYVIQRSPVITTSNVSRCSQKHRISRPHGRSMGYFLWVQNRFVPLLLHCKIPYGVISNRVITRLGCITFVECPTYQIFVFLLFIAFKEYLKLKLFNEWIIPSMFISTTTVFWLTDMVGASADWTVYWLVEWYCQSPITHTAVSSNICHRVFQFQAQFKFLYDLAVAYMKRNDMYANFKWTGWTTINKMDITTTS